MVLNQCESDKLIQLCFQPFLFLILPKEICEFMSWTSFLRETYREKSMHVGRLTLSSVNGFIFNSIWKAGITLCGTTSSITESMCSPFSRRKQSFNTPLQQAHASMHN